MRIAIQTLGTRGDVQPYLALAIGLVQRGHIVQLAAPVQFESMINARHIEFAPLPGEFLALLDLSEGKAAIAGSSGFGAGFKLLTVVRPLMRRLFDESWHAAMSFAPDVIIWHPKSISGPHIAEALGCPSILASPLPGFTPTGAFPSPLLPFRSLGPLNRLSHWPAINAAEMVFGRTIQTWRQSSLGLRRGTAPRPAGTLYAYSRHVLTVPADWKADVLVSGYWFLDDDGWQPDARLTEFLGAGEQPVYIGFGSMPGLDPESLTQLAIEALHRTDKRGILATGGGALAASESDPPPFVFVTDSVPHDKVFPLVRSTFHHGGAGTTAAALRAGKPTAVCPFFGDQPFWGRRVAELGVGPQPLDRKALSVENLASAIEEMEQPNIRANCQALGKAISTEDGIGKALRFIEQIVARSAAGPV